jgi:hypothetical protein
LNKKRFALLIGILSISAILAFVISEIGTSKAEHDTYQEENTVANNLKTVTKILEKAIQKGQLTTPIYDNVMKRLVAVEARMTTDGLKNKEAILSVVDYSDKVVKSTIKDTNPEILAKRAKSIQALERLQDKLGVAKEARRADGLLATGTVIQMDDTGGTGTVNPTEKGAQETEAQFQERLAKLHAANGGGFTALPKQSTGIISNAPKAEQQSSTQQSAPKATPLVAQPAPTSAPTPIATPAPAPQVTQQSAPAPVSTAINTSYYGHTYGVKSQVEYDCVRLLYKY